ncbi:MAG: oxygenase MpaB family protein [Nevskia sp.]
MKKRLSAIYQRLAAAPLQERLRRTVVTVLPRNVTLAINYDEPLGDPGLFGPDSVAWRIHSDFPGMMTGGICALMLQTLHPLALAGVWDHSNFREDLLGRLRRTTAFVAGTTFASTAEAQRLIARVIGIHRRVVGKDEDGRSYAADDPQLLTWVHTTEMWCFLRGYRRYRKAALPLSVQDRYYAETCRIAEALGARDVPQSVAEVDAYFAAVLPELRYSERSREVLAVLDGIRLPIPLPGVSKHLFLGAGAALLPDWAAARLRRTRLQRWRDGIAAQGLRALAPTLRAALKEGASTRGCRRVGIDPASLSTF